MTQSKPVSLVVTAIAFAVFVTIGALPADAGPPSVVHADADYEASGYVTPAGMVPPSMYTGGVMPVGYVGRDSGCDAPGVCDAMGSCGSPTCGSGNYGGGLFDSGCSDCGGDCDGNCGSGGIFSDGCLLGKMCQGSCLFCKKSQGGCCMANLGRLCLFCRGEGCSACQMCSMLSPASMLAALHTLRPYGAAGIHAQRWYDFSAEALYLSHSSGSGGFPLTTLGVAPGVTGDPVPANQVVLRLDDADSDDDSEFGLRLSAAFIFGAGGNIEGTYMGGNEWSSEASAQDPNGGLFSFISDFGRDPINGFDDTDRSLIHSVESESEFHSGELNYRRRTVGPYGRFQSSWLIGLRYVRFESGLLYSTEGFNNNGAMNNGPRFFSSDNNVRNNLFGPQAGLDLWWNVIPGVNLGVGVKGAWVQNDIDSRLTLTANSLNSGAPAESEFDDRESTIMGEFEAKLAYRLCHSWTIRSAYYVIAADDIAFGTVNPEFIRGVIDPLNNPQVTPEFETDSLVIQGFSLGAEYIW